MGITWELDFYSRPVLDERKKKRWEVLITTALDRVDADPKDQFQFSQYVSNSDVNSDNLKTIIAAAIAQAPAPPSRIRFFRFAMQAMITRACDDLGIAAVPSRRTLALQTWLQERNTTVYPQDPGYTAAPSPTVGSPPPIPRPLPDALVGQQWAFVTLPAQDFQDFGDWPMDFGEGFPLTMAGVSPEAMVPGLVIFSPRALAMAGWMSGLELGEVRIEASTPPRLILETGAADSWILATLATPALQQEAQAFDQTKAQAQGVHFLAVQTSPEQESFAGFWLMKAS